MVDQTPPYRSGPAMVGMAIAAALLLAGGGVAVGTLIGNDEATPRQPVVSAVDAGFLQDMQAHHAQAVEMAVLIRDRTTDEEIRALALDIELTQQQQIGQMYGLLASSGLPQSNPQPMDWVEPTSSAEDPHASMAEMDPDGAMTMPGMATEEDLDRLAGLRGRAAERLFLDLMIAHHRGGLPMAEYAKGYAEQEWVRTLAARIVEAQTAEIEALIALLDERGGPLG